MNLFVILILLSSGFSSISTAPHGAVQKATPEYLFKLLEEKKHDEFSQYTHLRIPHFNLTESGDEMMDPIFHPDLFEGDIVLTFEQQEMARQAIRFDKEPGARWPGEPAIVPYVIASTFLPVYRKVVTDAIDDWNKKQKCIKFQPLGMLERIDYVMFYPGDGCFSTIGRSGLPQVISIKPESCTQNGRVLHEMSHTVGMRHEHTRIDRDYYIKILWENIPEDWKDQYEKIDPDESEDISHYDYYSVMHYPIHAPDGKKPAFKILKHNVNKDRVGQRIDVTETDILKVEFLYCN